jgi:hypothetical protein
MGVLLAVRVVGVAAHLFEGGLPRRHVIRACTGPGAELGEDQAAGIEREVGVLTEL